MPECFRLIAVWLLLLIFCAPAYSGFAGEVKNGRDLIGEILSRHEQYPYVYEEQTMIMSDAAGNRDVRQLRRYFRMEKDGAVKFLLVFDTPAAVRGTALLGNYSDATSDSSSIYLPALGQLININTGSNRASHFLGTDFTAENLMPERVGDYIYKRRDNLSIDDVEYLVVDALPANISIEQATGCSRRQHLIRPDNLFIIRTDYFDRHGRLFKRQSHHDLRQLGDSMWRSNMVLMENFRENHKTLIKIHRRVFSGDYVPAEMFTAQWLLDNSHIGQKKKQLLEQHDNNNADSETPKGS